MKNGLKVLTAVLAIAGFAAFAAPASAGVISEYTIYEFSWLGTGGSFATGCTPADPGGLACTPASDVPTTPADAPAWTFVAPASGALFGVQDAFAMVDKFEVFDFGVSMGTTSAPPGGACGDSIAVCYTSGASHGLFVMAPGAHSITIKHLEGVTGAAFFAWAADEGSRVPTPAGAGLALLGMAGAMVRRRRG
jgi:hypothetical protein